jgi:hypothetical protein
MATVLKIEESEKEKQKKNNKSFHRRLLSSCACPNS